MKVSLTSIKNVIKLKEVEVKLTIYCIFIFCTNLKSLNTNALMTFLSHTLEQSSDQFFARPTRPEKQKIKLNFIIHCVTVTNLSYFS